MPANHRDFLPPSQSQQIFNNEQIIKPNYLNNSTKKWELEGGAYIPNYRSLNQDIKISASPLKGFHNHYFMSSDNNKSSSEIFMNRRDFYDKINVSNMNKPDDLRQRYIQYYII